MDITTTARNDVTIISVAGSMDATTAPEFDEAWKKVLADGVTKLVVELKSVEYISSAGLRSILMIAKTCRAQKVSLAFAGMQAMVADMFKLSGFMSILKTFPDVETAISQL